MTLTRTLISAAVAAAALAATPALADPPAGGPGWRNCPTADGAACPGGYGGHGPGAGHGQGHGRGPGMMGPGPVRGGAGFANPAAMVEGRLAALKVELKITAAQEKAWSTFADSARTQSTTMLAHREQRIAQAQAGDVPAPERLARRTELARQHSAAMETMSAAVKDLYGALDDEQKKLADQWLAHGPRGGFGGGRGARR